MTNCECAMLVHARLLMLVPGHASVAVAAQTGKAICCDDKSSGVQYCQRTLTTIHTAFNPADAHLVRSRLEAAGFHAVVTNELSALSIDGYSMAAGGILVQVPASEAAEARDFLELSRPVDETSEPPPPGDSGEPQP